MADAEGAQGLAAWAAAHGMTRRRRRPPAADHAAARRGRGARRRSAGERLVLQVRRSQGGADRPRRRPLHRRRHPRAEGQALRPLDVLPPGRGRAPARSRFRGHGRRGGTRSSWAAPSSTKYRVYAAPQRDDVWFHELFSPAFIVFLIELAPKGFAFEYVEGTLCVSVLGRQTLAEDLDGLRDATVELVRRIRGEIAERLGHADAARAAPGATGFGEAGHRAALAGLKVAASSVEGATAWGLKREIFVSWAWCSRR